MPKKKLLNRARTGEAPLAIRRDESKGTIWSHVRKKELIETPEELVRQSYLPILVNEYGFALDQIEEELNLTGRGSAKARADFVVWRRSEVTGPHQ